MGLVLSTLSNHALYLSKFCQSISQDFRVMDMNSRVDARVVTEICKGALFCKTI